MLRKLRNNRLILGAILLFCIGVIIGVCGVEPVHSGELYNVKPYPEGRVWVPGNVIITITNDKWDTIDMQCVPIKPHDTSKTNPENYQQ